jgi:predicted N-acyltransferase
MHVTFLTREDEWGAGRRRLPAPARRPQFHFFNEGYGDFDDFLAALASRKRKVIRRERGRRWRRASRSSG